MIYEYRKVRANEVGLIVSDGGPMPIPTEGYRYATVHAEPFADGTAAPTWSTAVLTVKRGNSPAGPFYGLESAVTVTNSTRMSAAFDLRGFGFLAVEVTTAEGSDRFLNVYVCLSNTPA